MHRLAGWWWRWLEGRIRREADRAWAELQRLEPRSQAWVELATVLALWWALLRILRDLRAPRGAE